jgi:hypothetical protein
MYHYKLLKKDLGVRDIDCTTLSAICSLRDKERNNSTINLSGRSCPIPGWYVSLAWAGWDLTHAWVALNPCLSFICPYLEEANLVRMYHFTLES